MPSHVEHLYDSIVHLESIGFQNVMVAFCDPPEWTEQHLRTLEGELDRLAEFYVAHYLSGDPIGLRFFDGTIRHFIKYQESGQPVPRRNYQCGAGYNYQMIDFEGNIWPCHRFDGAIQKQKMEEHLKLGTVFAGM